MAARVWKVRFASPLLRGRWQWESFSAPRDAGLSGQHGDADASKRPHRANRFERHGFWRIPPGERNLRHADGTPALLVADTAWALPWRATHAQCEVYAQHRQAQGFNAVLLMSVQPDRRARGPRSRTEHDGFDVGFEDLPDGHINQFNVAYFQYPRSAWPPSCATMRLSRSGIRSFTATAGKGWMWPGRSFRQSNMRAIAATWWHATARSLRIWLVAADGDGLAPGVDPGGWEIERWDAYQQPTGIHYAPHQDPWAYQDRAWLDFQWCQTGPHR